MKNRKAGSITVFLSLMLMVIGSLLFTLLEGSHYIMLGMMSKLNSQIVTESMFAEYNVPAYQNYHLFMMDSGYGSGQLMLSKVNAAMQKLGQENLNPAISGFGRYSNFLQMNVTDSNVTGYELASDADSRPLLKQMAQIMKMEMPADLMKKAKEKIEGIEDAGRQGEKADDYLDGALDTLEQAKEDAREEQKKADHSASSRLYQFAAPMSVIQDVEINGSEYTYASDIEAENPMEDVKSAKSSPILAQILSDSDRVSTKKMEKGDAIEQRTLNTGNYSKAQTVSAADKILITQYLQKYTSNYRNKDGLPHALAYEQEYLVFGKYTDEDNLEKMAGRLLLVREGINFAYLLSDSVKREEALAMAAAVTAFAGIPAAVKAVQMGILASWAYAESIVELRTLFSGGKTAVIKTSENWTVSLSETAAVLFNSSMKSKQVSNGLAYKDYLLTFLMAESSKKLGLRFGNLLEKNIRLYSGYEQAKLDCMLTAMKTDSVYQAQHAFLSFVTITHLSRKGYRYEETCEFSYLE